MGGGKLLRCQQKPTKKQRKTNAVEGWGRVTVGSMWFVGQFATLSFPFAIFIVWGDGHIMMWDGHITMGPPQTVVSGYIPQLHPTLELGVSRVYLVYNVSFTTKLGPLMVKVISSISLDHNGQNKFHIR